MIITLTTDFGDGTAYVAAMKGSLLAVNPAASLVDLNHHIPPQDLSATAYFLSATLRWFPSKTIHVVVVDPGVGTGRALLCVEWAGQTVLAPDNGCWTPILRPAEPPPRVYRLEERRFWRPEVCLTFHGRDILAPVAGHLSLGVNPAELGPPVHDWVRLTLRQPQAITEGIRGEVVTVDSFGNLVTNIPAAEVPAKPSVRIADQSVDKLVKTYGDADPGTVVVLIGSTGHLELAVVNGSAAVRLGAVIGSIVEVRRNS